MTTPSHRHTSSPLRNLLRSAVGTAGWPPPDAKGASRAPPSRLTALSRLGTVTALVAGVSTGTGCGGELTTQEVARVTEETRSALRVARRIATVLDFLHLLPTDACGEPEQHFVSRIVPDLEQAFGCTVVTRTSEDAVDVVRLSFPDQGCTYRGRTLQGTLLFTFNAGEDRKDLVLDFNEVLIDGKVIPARGGYGECGDSQTYWADVAGKLPQSEDRRYVAGGKFKQVDGFPIVGGNQASLDAAGLMITGTGTSRLRVAGLVLMLFKKPIPRRGELEIDLEDGRFIRAKVQNEDLEEDLIDVEVQLDDKAPLALKVAL
jgi:hypothetical protein